MNTYEEHPFDQQEVSHKNRFMNYKYAISQNNVHQDDPIEGWISNYNFNHYSCFI